MWTREGQEGEEAAMPNGPTQSRRSFDEAFKRDAVALLLQGHSALGYKAPVDFENQNN